MTYERYNTLFERKPKRREYKVLWNGDGHLYKRDNGDLDFYFGWGTDPKSKKHIATLTRDNLVYVRYEPDGYEVGVKLRLSQLLGHSVYHYGSFYSRHKHKARFWRRGHAKSVPVTTELVVDVRADNVLQHSPDLRMYVDREKSQPIYDYLKEAKTIAHTLHRLGVFDEQINEDRQGRVEVPRLHPDVLQLKPDSYALALDWAIAWAARSTYGNRSGDVFGAYLTKGLRKLRAVLQRHNKPYYEKEVCAE